MTGEKYAILREAQSEMDVEKASEALAPILGRACSDVQKDLRVSPGILAVGLSEPLALEALKKLRGQGTRVFALPHSKLVGLPPAVELRHGKVLPDGFLFEAAHRRILAPWNEIVWFDSARVKTEKRVKVTEIKTPTVSYRGARSSFGVTRKSRSQLEWEEFFEALCGKPWVRFRVDKARFGYAQTGLPVHPTRENNFLALVVTFKTRCTNAVEGPGIGPLFDGRPETRRSALSMRAYENYLLWQVQLLFRKNKGSGH